MAESPPSAERHPGASFERLERFMAAPHRAVWTLAAPMMGGMAAHLLYLIADTAFIGALGTEALAAVTFVGPLFFVIMALTMGLGTAVTALVAQAIGRRDPAAASRVAGTSLTVGMGVGAALAGASWLAGPQVLAALGARGDCVALAWEYFQIVALMMPLFFASTTFRSVLTGEGDARTPMLVMGAATILNVGLDWLFIFGLELGLRGAALATAVAHLVALGTLGWLLLRRSYAPGTAGIVRFHRAGMVPSVPLLKALANLALPSTAGMLVMALGGMFVNRVLAEFGQIAVAAYGAASKVDMIVALPIMGLAGAAVSVVGMFAGAGRADLVRSTALYTYRWSLTMAVLIGLSAYAGSTHIIGIFTSDLEAISIGHTYLGFMLFGYPLMAVGMTTGRLLQGLGHGVPSLIITAVRVLLIGVPAAYLAVFAFGAPLEVVWLSFLAGGMCSTTLAVWWVRRLMWLRDPTVRANPGGDQSAERAPSGAPAPA